MSVSAIPQGSRPSSARRILLVEDDEQVLRVLTRTVQRDGYTVVEAHDGAEAVEILERGVATDLIITDLDMPRAGGREVLEAGLKRGVPVVIVTGHPSVQTAVELMRLGAANFLTKPFTLTMVREVFREVFGPSDAERAQRPAAAVGRDESFRRVLESVETVAETDATVLIGGETGTGKEVVARAIHAASRRAGGPFVAVNCGAIPEALFESELFGHVRGAFTGATHPRAGRFQLANSGTLFLDEIGDIPLSFQVKLLRALQERQIELLGEGVGRPVDVRVIAASHRDLRRLIDEGKFREDLYYRLAVVELRLPALRDRPGDIPLLIDHFIELSNARHQRSVLGISPEALAALVAYPWPGNVRELANVVERMVVFRRTGLLVKEDAPPRITDRAGEGSAPTLPLEGLDLRRAVEALEDSLIAQALARTGGNRKAAADLLGLNRTTLVERLRRKP